MPSSCNVKMLSSLYGFRLQCGVLRRRHEVNRDWGLNGFNHHSAVGVQPLCKQSVQGSGSGISWGIAGTLRIHPGFPRHQDRGPKRSLGPRNMAHRISVPLARNVRNDFCRAINRQYGLRVRINAVLPRLGVCGRWTPRALRFTSGRCREPHGLATPPMRGCIPAASCQQDSS